MYDASGDLAAEYDAAAPASAPSYALCYLTADPLGSTRLTTDGAGGAATRFDYPPFGDEVPACSYNRRPAVVGYGADDVRLQFIGKSATPRPGWTTSGLGT